MYGVALSVAMQAVMLVSGADAYEDAYQKSTENGTPLLVLVGADWCPGCVTMKQGVLARLRDRGRLHRVNYTTVNLDESSDLAGKLMQGGTIPQLIVFTKTPNGWHREQITGATSEDSVESLIDKALAMSAVKPPLAPETVLK